MVFLVNSRWLWWMLSRAERRRSFRWRWINLFCEHLHDYVCTIIQFFLHNVRRSHRDALTSCTGMTCHARREYIFSQNCNICSVLSIFKCNSGETNDKFIASSKFLSSGIIPTSPEETENDELLYTIRSLVMVREISCQRKGLILSPRDRTFVTSLYIHTILYIVH